MHSIIYRKREIFPWRYARKVWSPRLGSLVRALPLNVMYFSGRRDCLAACASLQNFMVAATSWPPRCSARAFERFPIFISMNQHSCWPHFFGRGGLAA